MNCENQLVWSSSRAYKYTSWFKHFTLQAKKPKRKNLRGPKNVLFRPEVWIENGSYGTLWATILSTILRSGVRQWGFQKTPMKPAKSVESYRNKCFRILFILRWLVYIKSSSTSRCVWIVRPPFAFENTSRGWSSFNVTTKIYRFFFQSCTLSITQLYRTHLVTKVQSFDSGLEEVCQNLLTGYRHDQQKTIQFTCELTVNAEANQQNPQVPHRLSKLYRHSIPLQE